MKNKNLIIIFIIVIVVLIISFVVIRSEKVTNPSPREDAVNDSKELTETFNLKHQYKDGEHVYAGSIQLPSPCHSFNAEIVETDNDPEIRITINQPEQDQVCTQVITERDFKVVYPSENEEQNFRFFINDKEYKLNLFEVSPEEDIDSVNLFIKG